MKMMLKFIKYPISAAIALALLTSCESDYTKLVKAELAKGIRKDSVLLGINLGNTRNEFYGRCFDLNKAHLITPGTSGTIQYVFTDSIVHKKPQEIRLLFVPAFDDNDVITNIDMKFNYTGWAPWNRALQSDSLEVKLKQLLMRWYGGNDFVMAHVQETDIPVKVDGNRRLMVMIYDPQSVVVHAQDILHPKFRHTMPGEDKKAD